MAKLARRRKLQKQKEKAAKMALKAKLAKIKNTLLSKKNLFNFTDRVIAVQKKLNRKSEKSEKT